MPDWQLNSSTEVTVDAPAERLWAALTDPADTERYFMKARVTVGDVGEAYRLTRPDGWGVDGLVLAKEAPHRLRVSWGMRTPPGLDVPRCEVEYLVEPQTETRTKLTVNEYVDGPMPPSLAAAGRTGWALMTRGLKAYLG